MVVEMVVEAAVKMAVEVAFELSGLKVELGVAVVVEVARHGQTMEFVSCSRDHFTEEKRFFYSFSHG